MTSLKGPWAAAIIGATLSLSLSAQAGQSFNPVVNGKAFNIDCDRDLPNGQPTYSFIRRLDQHLGHSHLKSIAPEREKSAVFSYRQSHKKIDNMLIKPAIQKCG